MNLVQHSIATPIPSDLIHILVVDSQPIVLQGLNSLLTEDAGCLIIATVNTANTVVESVKKYQPDILLMDIHLPNIDGVMLTQEVIALNLLTKIVVFTNTLTEHETCGLISNGVKGILLKEMPTKLITECLQRVHNGDEWLERRSIMLAFEKMLQQSSEPPKVSDSLSPRELELAKLIAMGCSNKTASQKLFLSEGSVRVYLSRIYEKLQISSRLQLALYFQ